MDPTDYGGACWLSSDSSSSSHRGELCQGNADAYMYCKRFCQEGYMLTVALSSTSAYQSPLYRDGRRGRYRVPS